MREAGEDESECGCFPWPGITLQQWMRRRKEGRVRIHRALLIGRESEKIGVMMETQFLWEADPAMIEAFIPSSAAPGYEGQGQQDDPRGTMGEAELGDTVLLQKLRFLVEDTPENWTYGIFWQLSRSPTEL